MATRRQSWARVVFPAVISLAALAATRDAPGQGIYIPSVGAVNQSMSGATVAAPIDAIGSLAWNPAAISGVPQSEVAFGLGLVLPTTSLSSAIPAFGLAGTTDSEPGVAPVPTFGIVHHCADSPWTFGLGVFAVGGFSANYPASTTNPILFPQATQAMPLGGLGQMYTRGEVFQIVPTVSYALSERLSIGFAPTVTLAGLNINPLVFAPPNDANNDGFFTYGPGNGTRLAWGGGFQVGAYLTTDSCWNFGFSYKSPQWMEPFRFNSQDELGGPLFATVRFELPSIVSLGVSYTGFERLLLATDFRYFDYTSAPGFGDQGFRLDGSVAGVGWDSVFSVSQGVQYLWSDCVTLRGGYTFTENPIGDDQTMFNVASSLIIQHWLSVGATCRLCESVSTTLAWSHGFENQITGPILTPAGPVAGTSVTARTAADILNFSVTVTY